MRTMKTAIAAVIMSAPLLAQIIPPIAPGDVTLWSEVDAADLKGRPARLAWSPDGAQLYLRTVEGSSAASLKLHHYLVARGGQPTAIDAEPAWAEPYWAWKSSKNFFGDTRASIQIERKSEMVANLNAPADGKAAYLGDGRTDRNLPSTMSAKAGTSKVTSRLMLMDQIVGEFVDEQIVPGYTFSWSPRPLRRIAYRSTQGRLSIMTLDGSVETVEGAHDVVLPAWSSDGASLAYIDLSNRKRIAVRIVTME